MRMYSFNKHNVKLVLYTIYNSYSNISTTELRLYNISNICIHELYNDHHAKNKYQSVNTDV